MNQIKWEFLPISVTLLGLQVPPFELAAGLCPASLPKSLFVGLVPLSPTGNGRMGSRAPRHAEPRGAPRSCPGCVGRHRALLHRGRRLSSPGTLGSTSTDSTKGGRQTTPGASRAPHDASTSSETPAEAELFARCPQRLP